MWEVKLSYLNKLQEYIDYFHDFYADFKRMCGKYCTDAQL